MFLVKKHPIVLVHGSWHANWCWNQLGPFLENQGHPVVAPSLPGHNIKSPSIEQMTLEKYVHFMCEIVKQQPDPVLLVGHSMGGMVISEVAERCPIHVKRLVYLAAFLPQNGQCITDLVQPQIHMPAPFEISSDGRSAVLTKAAAREKLYNDCPQDVAEQACDKLIPQALSVFRDRAVLTEENFGRVPKTYISCTRDNSIWPETQRAMYSVAGCDKVHQMTTGHASFLSQPEQLAALLVTE